jgi:cell division protein FtsB
MTLSLVLEALGGVRAAIFALLAFLLLVGFGVQTFRLGSAKKDLLVAEATTANMTAALKQLEAEGKAQKARADKAVVEYAEVKSKLDRAKAKVVTKLEKVYVSDKQSQEWGRVPVPDAVVEQLRQPAR